MAYKSLVSLALLALSGATFAQTPETSLFVDLRLALILENNDRLVFRWYDPNGYPSVVGFNMVLESGHKMKISQRLQNFETSAETNSLDEFWIEDTGIWRIGKQYMPFGSRNLLREAVLSARYDTVLVFDDVPISIAYGDDGTGRTRGVSGRIGRNFGVSFAIGDHFGIHGTSLTQVQLPKEGLGRGRGYQTAFGADWSLPIGGAQLDMEFVSFRNGHTPLDETLDVLDVKATWFIDDSPDFISLAWTRRWDTNKNFWRFEGQFNVDPHVWWSPYVRFNGVTMQDVGIYARIRF